MPELVTIPIAFFEFAASYERAVFKLWIDRAEVVQTIFDALKPWNPSVDDMEAVNTGKTSEQGLTIKLPLKGVSFFFGPASCKFSRNNIHWSLADETLAILDAAVSALLRSGGVVLGPKRVVLAMHLQPKSVPFTTILSPFIIPPLAAMHAGPIVTMAAVAKWADYKITLDGSAALANALFLSFEREFPASTTYQEIIHQISQDEANLFKLLGVEEEKA